MTLPTVPLAIIDQLSATAQGLAAAAAAGLLGLVVSLGTAALLWHLLKALISTPSWDAVKRAALGVLVAVFAAGATPGLVQATYNWGTSFGADTATSGALPGDGGQ